LMLHLENAVSSACCRVYPVTAEAAATNCIAGG
jgi:hypothetical protein